MKTQSFTPVFPKEAFVSHRVKTRDVLNRQQLLSTIYMGSMQRFDQEPQSSQQGGPRNGEKSPDFCPAPDREGIFLPPLISKGTGSNAHLSVCHLANTMPTNRD